MARYKETDEVIYAGNREVYTIVDMQQDTTVLSYLLVDSRGKEHWCHSPSLLRLHKRWTTKV